MSSAVFFYQAALIGSVWYFTSSYGWLGYMLTMMFWAAFTFFRAQTFKLKLIQTSVLIASGYIMWESAYADLLKTAESAGTWLLIGSSVTGLVFLVLVFRWLSGIVYANMSKRIEDAKDFLARPKLESIKETAKSGALAACGISDVLDTRAPVYLSVPYQEKEQAKALGARWDPKRQAWYVPPGLDVRDFERWALKKISLPVDYDSLTPGERREVREAYVRLQGGKCYHCGHPLSGSASKDIMSRQINAELFPSSFFDWPVHLHHDHRTGLTLGAVHSHCNAVLWQYYGE